jgi:SNF2 family DNA or RNA helicase
MIIHEDSNSILLRIKNPELIRKVLPKHVRDIDVQGHNLQVRHDLDAVKVLRNLGIKAPSPIRTQYNWPGRFVPFEHQKTTAEFLTFYSKAFVLNEMGTAKSASALWAADYLMNIGKIHKVLIISPLSTLEPVWQQEIFDVLMHRSGVILHGARDKRFDLLASDADFYIINPDGVGIVADTVRKRLDIDLVIIDEAAAYRNGTTKRYKDLLKLLRPDVRLWLMTGTPCPNAPTDAWALAKLVNPAKVPQYFTSWKRQTMMQITSYKWVPRPDSYDMAFQAMQPAIRFKKSECLDLPPVTYENRTCELSPEQKQAYKEMKNYMAAEASSHQITAVNAADQVGKLRQILCGAFKNPDTGEYVAMDHAPRLKVLLECIQDAGAKVLVIVPYKGIINVLKEEVEKHYTCDILNGDVSRTKRTEIITRFRRETDPHVLLCHPKVMAHGLTLTEADMVVFYAPIYSNEESQQVMDRINRPGQKLKMTIVRIGGATLEWSIYAMVEGKRLSQESILELYKKELEV